MSPAKPRSVTFSKYSGAGNDFLIVDERLQDAFGEASMIAKALCRRGVSVGADGLITLTLSDVEEGAVARMRLWNADGSDAAFSGNAARCAVRYLVDEGLASEEVRLQTDIGIVRGRVDGTTAQVAIPGHGQVWPGRRLRVEGRDLIGTYGLVGVPFFVVLHDDPDELPVRFLGRAIRTHSALQPAGANVDFVRVDDEQSLYFRVYERGVENETLSSGTGSIAAALAAAAVDRVTSPVVCQARGGSLTVRFRRLTPKEIALLEAGAPPDQQLEETAAPATPEGESEAGGPATVEVGGEDATPGGGPAGEEVAGENASLDASPEEAPASEAMLDGEPIVFGDLEIEGETRRVLTGTAFADALRLS
jgi:diaminopimelate epimerase